MTDEAPQSPEAIEAERAGERPDHGRMPDALADALSGSGVGSDTRAGSLQGGVATGSDDDQDQVAIDSIMRGEGRAEADPQSPSGIDPDPVVNTGVAPGEADADPVEGKRDLDADAATG